MTTPHSHIIRVVLPFIGPFIATAWASAFVGCASKTPPPVAQAAPVGQPGLVDEAALDRAVDPCDDFYQFACGSWLKNTPIPADRPLWGRGFSEIAERNQQTLRSILEDLAAGGGNQSDPEQKKLGDLYATCMDEQKAETASLATLGQMLDEIATVSDGKSLAKTIARLHLVPGLSPLFDFSQQQDFADSTKVIGVVDQAGLSLPDRDYYSKDDEKSQGIRKAYVEHVAKMLGMLEAARKPPAPVPPDASDKKAMRAWKKAEKEREKAAKKAPVPKTPQEMAESVMKIETTLATASMRRVDRREPKNIYHRLERKGLAEKAPKFDWDTYFTEIGTPAVQEINVTAPDFFAALAGNDGVVAKTDLDAIKTYLSWHALRAAAAHLGAAYVDEAFAFRSKNLTGEQQNLPRWKRCVGYVDSAMGEALAKPFITKTFGEDGKSRTREMVEGIEAAFAANLDKLAWMDAETRTAADGKMKKVANKVGYPERWRDYAPLAVGRESHLANMRAAGEFEVRRQLAKIGKPVARDEWLMTPPTVNAYYEASLNEMVFPAGILQPPFFNRAAGDPTNYGAIGMVVGHELTHGFDDEGRKFDGDGNLREWWSAPVIKSFEERAECVAKQYSSYVPIDDMHLDGKLTLGENIADLGGMKLSFQALKAKSRKSGEAALAAGFTEEQQFFLGYAQSWCTNIRPETARMRVITDPHSPPRYRVNGVVVNLPEFAGAFQCKPGAKMAPKAEDRCTVW